MIEAEWWEYGSVDEMADAVAGDIGFIVESAIDARNAALLALPGGETPRPVYAKLVEAGLPWKRVTIIPGDERLVHSGSGRSAVLVCTGDQVRLGIAPDEATARLIAG